MPLVLLLVVAGVALYVWAAMSNPELPLPEVVVSTLDPDRDKVRRALRAAAARWALNPEWLDALGYVETRWQLDAVNNAGPDAARGGAFGPTQITQKTAKAHGYTGDPAAFCTDAELAAEWTARIAAAASPVLVEDLGAWWNAGRYHARDLPPGHVTAEVYIPRLLEAVDYVHDNPPTEVVA